MARLADITARARATVGHIIRFVRNGAAHPQPNRPNLDFAGNCTVTDTGDSIRVTVPDVPAGSVTVGRTITLPPGRMAFVHNLGTNTHAILEFGIPQGGIEGDAVLGVFNGGTGASTPEGARLNLGVPSTEEFEAGLVSKADDSTVVHLTGDESIAGGKTFTGEVLVPAPDDESDALNAATTAWVRQFVRQYVEERLGEIYLYAKDGNSPDVDPPLEDDDAPQQEEQA